MDYLQQHKDTLIPELRKVWEAAGFKSSGPGKRCSAKSGRRMKSSWPGPLRATSTGWWRRAKAEYPIPMFTNCPQLGFGTAPAPLRGGGQSGGAMADAVDVWRAGGPRIDLFAADIYSPTSWGFAPGTRNPETRCSYPRPGVTWKPRRSMPSDATMPSDSR